MLDLQRLSTLVAEFLNVDKKNLLMIYAMYLFYDRKPSRAGVCNVH